ncbi:glycoside hydrolase family 9 protein [Massilibacteroides vaginae]|uniref:glycoside hydrolase family 9 protein n=1 Tax=Massilibacteroides vaginae TaxID=1673718 RepID=UPI001FECA1CB|nr:glycoside hydrolase family 9 protein [Massilibacteroides vaginae]
MRKSIPVILLLLFVASCGMRDLPLIDSIRFNQLGFYPLEEKIAVYTDQTPAHEFLVRDVESGKVIYSSVVSAPRSSVFSDKHTYVLDFSSVESSGKYRLELPGIGRSDEFEINSSVLSEVAKAGVKAFYFHRASTPIEEQYAGKWNREAAHIDDKILVHSSAASSSRPEGAVISSSKGWYDAGDYNKYIVNSGFTVAILLSLYEDYSEQLNGLNMNIPESKNSTPDLLDEIHWNLDWMLTMQDPKDGGVYHKLTNPVFEGFITPIECKQQRYVVAKSVTATLDFAASMAQASRIFQAFNNDYPGFADKALAASEKAFAWALNHSESFYRQGEFNKIFKPEIKTGEYGDRSVEDEFFWASTELYITTRKSEYLDLAKKYIPEAFKLPDWSNVASLGTFSLLRCLQPDTSAEIQMLLNQQQEQLLSYAAASIEGADQSPYHAPYGRFATDFFWGCNSDAASSQGMTFLYAWKLTGDRNYLSNALRNMDYILGKNATGYCYVTGFGSKSPMHPHHRLSASDEIAEPLPGFLIGGPNPGKQDGCTYPSSIPDECYIDIVESYASNEIAINWQALFSYFSSALHYNLE